MTRLVEERRRLVMLTFAMARKRRDRIEGGGQDVPVSSYDSDPAVVQIPLGPTGTFIRFSSCHRPHDDVVLVFTVEIEGPGLSASTSVTTLAGDGLTEFVQALDADFRGWAGVRTWTSLEGDLEVRAIHRGGSVDLQWTLRFPRELGTGDRFWTATLFLALRPGEDLKAMATDIQYFIDTAMR